MSKNIIELFVMDSCQVCPQMERLFRQLLKNSAIDDLTIIDIGKHPDIARQHNIRSVPYYLINDVAFYGLKTATEINSILGKSETGKFMELIKGELSEGQLQPVEDLISGQQQARDAMLLLLNDSDTSLVVRIGLSAVIESMTDSSNVLNDDEQQFIQLVEHSDQRIAVDALYYLSLLATADSLKKLSEISLDESNSLQAQAAELVEEYYSQEPAN